MKIDLKWDEPVRLKPIAESTKIYHCAELEDLSEGSAVYVFARQHGATVAPLYIGQTKRLKKRMARHFNSLRLMGGIRNARAGRRILLVGHLLLHRGQQEKKVLEIVESALIKRALAEGHDL